MSETNATGPEPLTDADTEADARAADLRFVTPNVTHEEAAAVTAVLLAVIDEQAVEASVTEPTRNRWVRSGRALRSPIAVGNGNWARSDC
jgi:hypothetical protein